MTQYVVLSTVATTDQQEAWAVVGEFDARDARAAVSAYVKDNGKPGGSYIAVPTRSFKPITVATETQTKLVFS